MSHCFAVYRKQMLTTTLNYLVDYLLITTQSATFIYYTSDYENT